MSIEVDVVNALAVQASAIAAVLGLPISFPGVPYAGPEQAKYLEVRHFRNSNLNPTWGDEKTLMGIYQITIVDPLQEGEIPASVIASQIIDAFHKNTSLYSGVARVMVYENPTLLTTLQQGQKALYPVSISYRCFKA